VLFKKPNELCHFASDLQAVFFEQKAVCFHELAQLACSGPSIAYATVRSLEDNCLQWTHVGINALYHVNLPEIVKQ